MNCSRHPVKPLPLGGGKAPRRTSRLALIALCCLSLGPAPARETGISKQPRQLVLTDHRAPTTDHRPLFPVHQPLFDPAVQPCQALGPAAPHPICGVDCVGCNNCGECGWDAMGPLPWQQYGQGEYVGHDRLPHVPEYRLRVDDEMNFVYRVTRNETTRPYELNVGDRILVESFTDPNLNTKELVIQPDGTITLRLLGQVKATRRTVTELRDELEEQFKKYYNVPAITVTPVQVNTKLEDLRATVDARFGFGGQSRAARIVPDGTVALPMIGSVMIQGLTLDEAAREINERYADQVEGIEVTPVLVTRAPRYVFVLGEVRLPGRFTLEGPTTVMQSIALAGGWIHGGNLRQVVVFRRGDDWRLMATRLDIRGALYGHRPCPADEIWLSDADVVVVPKSPIRVLDDWINLVFTQGLYGVAPFNMNVSYNFGAFGTLGP
jgi:polysaccharide export outer membrane protein